jgi:threonine synthase
MKYMSVRNHAPVLTFNEALCAGLASDGGLYVPENFPVFDLRNFSSGAPLTEVGSHVLAAFIDERPYKDHISEIFRRVIDFPISLVSLDDWTWILELYHGPTAAFKDIGARFLAECIAKLDTQKPQTVMVATSGDTGGAVAGAFYRKPGIDVVILFPRGMVSKFQEKQLTSWGENVHAFSVRGTFDDCQRIVKETFLDTQWKKKNLISANSINIGRILPQAIYYAWASLSYFQKNGKKPGFIVPSGNMGNALAGLWAKKMGFPIRKIVLAFNANRAVVDYFRTGQWQSQPTLATLANAMDVGNASNMERLRHLYPNLESLKEDADAFSVSDEEIKMAIQDSQKHWDRVLCPHTAAAAFVRHKLPGADWIIVATAHAAKFQSIVEPLVGKKIETPPSLELSKRQQGRYESIEPTLASLSQFLL